MNQKKQEYLRLLKTVSSEVGTLEYYAKQLRPNQTQYAMMHVKVLLESELSACNANSE